MHSENELLSGTAAEPREVLGEEHFTERERHFVFSFCNRIPVQTMT